MWGPSIPFGASASVKVRALIEAICSTAPCNVILLESMFRKNKRNLEEVFKNSKIEI